MKFFFSEFRKGDISPEKTFHPRRHFIRRRRAHLIQGISNVSFRHLFRISTGTDSDALFAAHISSGYHRVWTRIMTRIGYRNRTIPLSRITNQRLFRSPWLTGNRIPPTSWQNERCGIRRRALHRTIITLTNEAGDENGTDKHKDGASDTTTDFSDMTDLTSSADRGVKTDFRPTTFANMWSAAGTIPCRWLAPAREVVSDELITMTKEVVSGTAAAVSEPILPMAKEAVSGTAATVPVMMAAHRHSKSRRAYAFTQLGVHIPRTIKFQAVSAALRFWFPK